MTGPPKGRANMSGRLQDINFEVKEGEVLGYYWKKWSGQKYLLKLLSKVTAPTTGSYKAKGRIASLY
jgi:lipopolysaccharide transport system ATP-binding protein